MHLTSGLPNRKLAFISFLSNFLTYLLLTPTIRFFPSQLLLDESTRAKSISLSHMTRTMAFANPTIREIYDFIRPGEKPVEDPKPARDANFGSNAPRRRMQEMEDDRME